MFQEHFKKQFKEGDQIFEAFEQTKVSGSDIFVNVLAGMGRSGLDNQSIDTIKELLQTHGEKVPELNTFYISGVITS
jgi:hypothetical protein